MNNWLHALLTRGGCSEINDFYFIVLFYRPTSEVDVGDMAVEVEPPRQ